MPTLHAYLQGTVHPDWRRRGIGTELIGWLYARTTEMIAESGSTADAAIFQYVDEGNADAATLGQRLGLRTERWFSSMQRDLSEPIDAPAASEGVEVVAYTADRAEDVREARNDAFRDHWGSLPRPRASDGCSSSTGRSCGPTCRRSRSSTGASWRSASPR